MLDKAIAQGLSPEEADEHVHLINTDPEYRERWFANLARTVAVDFDGVLHPYTKGWQGFVPDDEPPMEGAKEFLQELVDKGFRVIVFSTRCDTPQGADATKAWLEKWGLDKLIYGGVTCTKPAAVAYVDDRAVSFRGDFRDCLPEIFALADGRAHGAAHKSS